MKVMLLLFSLLHLFGTQDILSTFINNIRDAGAIEMKFVIMLPQADGYEGKVVALGNMYRLENEYFDIYCDGDTKWTVSHETGEIYIFRHDTTLTDIVENPMGFFRGVNVGYDYSKPALEIAKSVHPAINGKHLYMIDLKPKSKRTAYKAITLGVDPDNYQPVLVKYTARDNSVISIVVTKFTKLSSAPDSAAFTLPSPIPAGYSVIDLR